MARMTLAEIRISFSTIDRTQMNATTDGNIDRQAKEDCTDVDLLGPAAPSPATVRHHSKLTQKDIAALAGVQVATWRELDAVRPAMMA